MTECEFYHEVDGQYYGCNKEAIAIIRRCDMCMTHYNMLLRDNKRRNNSGVKIPDNFDTLKNKSKFELGVCNKKINKPKPKEPFVGEDINVPEAEVVNGDGL